MFIIRYLLKLLKKILKPKKLLRSENKKNKTKIARANFNHLIL
ncbi:hypothetical protein GAPWK_1889 [Gilliamella apicola]|nr:hypothetical protein GAPWK_1889 [Gilliamella apicola]